MRMFEYRLVVLLLLFVAGTANSSDPIQKWSSNWDAHVSAGGCGIYRAYSDPTAVMFPELDGPDLQIFDNFEIRFHIQTAPGTTKSGAFELGNLYLWIYTTAEPKISKHQLQITGVRVNSLDLGLFSNGEETSTEFRLFYLGKEDSLSVWRSFLNHDAPIVQLHLSDGSSKELKAPAGPRDSFDKWARILRACSETDIPTTAEAGF